MFRELRKKKRELSKEKTIQVLEEGTEGVLSTIGENGYPYGIAVNYTYINNCIYFHCAKKGNKLDNIKQNEKVSFFVSKDVTILPQGFTTHYSSAVVFGRAKEITNEEKRKALIAITSKYCEEFMEEGMKYIDKSLDGCTLVKIEIDHMTGKISNYSN